MRNDMAFIKKYLPFILLNIAISAVTVLAVLFIWDWHQKSKLAHVPAPQPTAAISNTPSENTPEAISTTSPSKTNQPGESQVSIQLISGMGDLNLEYILIKNTGNSKLSLLDWSLRGSEQKSIHIKSDIMLNPGGAIKIYSKTGTDSALSIYLNSQQAYWKSGIVVTLHDPDLVERARYEIP
jgi:hypothetical protein